MQTCIPFSAEGSAVSKPRACSYSGITRGQIRRPLLLKGQFVTHGSQEERAGCPPQGHTGKHWDWSGFRRWERNLGRRLFCGFHGKEQARQGKRGKPVEGWLLGISSVRSGL